MAKMTKTRKAIIIDDVIADLAERTQHIRDKSAEQVAKGLNPYPRPSTCSQQVRKAHGISVAQAYRLLQGMKKAGQVETYQVGCWGRDFILPKKDWPGAFRTW